VILPGAAIPAGAQDLETVSRLTGVPLPDGYWARKAADPLAFELPNGFFGKRTSLPPTLRADLVEQPARAQFQGVARLPVILGLFADSPDPWITPDDVSRVLFDGPNPRGTLKEFYTEASLGAFTLEGDVPPWTRSTLTLAEVVGTGAGLGDDARVGEYLMEALAAVDDEVDFRQYDNDGPDGIPDSGDDDGVVDVVAFEFLEIAASCGGPGIWPHRWGISGWTGGTPWSSGDVGAAGTPVMVDGYIIQSAADCSGTAVQGAGTMAHEFGHALGLPDYYHPVDGILPELRRWVLGCWDLMAAGSWGCGPVTENRGPFGPTHMSAWNRHRLGWLDFVEVGAVRDTTYVLDPIRTSGQALRIENGGTPGEAFLVEFRDQGGFDRDLPATGVLVTLLYPTGKLRPATGEHYYLSVLEADGFGALVLVASQGGDRGSAGDVFGAGIGLDHMNYLTSPSTRTVGGTASPVAFHSFRVDGSQARVRLSNHPEPGIVAASEPVRIQAGVASPERGFRTVLVAGGFLPLKATPVGPIPRGLSVAEDGEHVVLTGVALESGSFQLPVEVRDARGSLASGTILLVVDPFQMEMARLADAVLGGTALTPGEEAYLDANGNVDGNLDVGDARAWRYPPGG